MITVYTGVPPTPLNVIEGDPPVDQSAQVAQLTTALFNMTLQRDALALKIANAQAALA